MKKIVFILMILTLVSCAPVNTYCPPREVERLMQEFIKLDQEWTVAYNIAGSTVKSNLTPAIKELQTLQSEAGSIKVPDCLKPAQNALNNYMQRIINGFTAIEAGESEDAVEKKFDSSDKFLDDFYDHIDFLQDCLPDCKNPD